MLDFELISTALHGAQILKISHEIINEEEHLAIETSLGTIELTTPVDKLTTWSFHETSVR